MVSFEKKSVKACEIERKKEKKSKKCVADRLKKASLGF